MSMLSGFLYSYAKLKVNVSRCGVCFDDPCLYSAVCLYNAVGLGGCTHVVHGRSRMTIFIDPRARTKHAGFSPTRQAVLAPSAKRREVLGESSMKGEPRPAKNRLWCRPSCIVYRRQASNELICFQVRPLPETYRGTVPFFWQ